MGCLRRAVRPGGLIRRPCFIGLDLASEVDLPRQRSCFHPKATRSCGASFRLLDSRREHAEASTSAPRSLRRLGAGWVHRGDPQEHVDDRFIKAQILKDCATYDVREIVYDRWGARLITQELIDENKRCVPFGQGFASMSAPTKELLRLIMARELAHNGNPVARWMVSNVAAKQDPAGNIKPDKERSAEKIDGVVALIMALGRALVLQEPTYQMIFL